MSIWKSLADPAQFRAEPHKKPVDPADSSAQRVLQQVEIKSLEIADDYDGGGDPYNRTGQFCVVKLNKDDQG